MVRRLFVTLLAVMVCAVGAMAQYVEKVSITTQAAMTDGEAYYTTFVSDKALDFSTMSDNVRAYVVVKTETKRCETIVNLEQCEWTLDAISCKAVQKVPANTGLLIKTRRPGTYSIPVASSGEIPTVKSSLVPVGSEDMDAYYVVSDYIDDIHIYNIPYVLERKSGRLAFFRERPTQSGWDGTQPIFAEGEITLKRNTAYLPLDYWQDVRDGSEMEGNGVNMGGMVKFETDDTFEDEPDYATVEIDVPVGVTDGTGYFITYFNRNQDLDFSQVNGLSAYIVTADTTKYRAKADLDTSKVVSRINLKEVQRVPAATPVVLKANRSTKFDVPTLDENTRLDDVSDNVLMAIAESTDVATMLNAVIPVFPYQLRSSTGYAGFGPNLPETIDDGRYAYGQIRLEPGSVYLPLSAAAHEYVTICEGKYLRFGIELVPEEDIPGPVIVPTVDVTFNEKAYKDNGYYTTLYTGEYTLDFTGMETVTAYVVTGENTSYYPLAEKGDSSVVVDALGRIDLKQIGVVEPQTSVVLYSPKPGTYSVPMAREDAPRYDASGNLLVWADQDLDVDFLAGLSNPDYLYTLQFDKDHAGFNLCKATYNELAQKNLLPQGTCFIRLGRYDHEYVQKSIEQYLPFGVTLTLPEIQKPDTLKPDTLKPDTLKPDTTKTIIDVNGYVADEAGNYTAFCSDDKALDFTDLPDIKAYIVRKREGQFNGKPVVTGIDLLPVNRVPAGTPVVVISEMPGEYSIPEAGDDTPLDDVSDNALLVKRRGGYTPTETRYEEARFFYELSVADGKAGFLPYSGYSYPPNGFICLELSDAAHQYVLSSSQKGLFFGQTLEVGNSLAVVDITNAVSDEAGNYTTFCSDDKALDFTTLTDIKAYIVVKHEDQYNGQPVITGIDLQSVNRVPAGTPIIIISGNIGAYGVPVIDDGKPTDNVAGNALLVKRTAEDIPAETRNEDTAYIYELTAASGKAGFMPYTGEIAIPDGFIHLSLTEAAHQYVLSSIQKALFFGETLEVSGIRDITIGTESVSAIYQLSGQKTSRPHRGVNIIRQRDGRSRKVISIR